MILEGESGRICRYCVMDESDPEIVFDSDGYSNHYYHFRNKINSRWASDEYSISNLEKKIGAIKASRKKEQYDCILGLSGGLDSSYMLHKLVTEFGMRPLVIHVDGGWNSETAVHNIDALVSKLNVDFFTEVINWQEMRHFQIAMFESGVPHLDIPQDMAFVTVLYQYAVKHNVPFIMNGGNVASECVQIPKKILYYGTDLRHINDIVTKYCDRRLIDFPFSSVFFHKIMLPIFRNLRVLKPLNYLDYSVEKASIELQHIYGWKPYGQKHFESVFTRFFEGYWLPNRFGYDMRKNQLSSLIFGGQKSREEALEILTQPALSATEVDNLFKYVASKLEIGEEKLKSYQTLEKKYYFDYKNNNHLISIGEKVISAMMGTQRGGAL